MKDNIINAHVPQEKSHVVSYFIENYGNVNCQATSERKHGKGLKRSTQLRVKFTIALAFSCMP